ncbi:MAG: gliding motility-associated C-terminal domain-containing protein [Saprospiraceae bacterium]|nr:gliding motility-associated C-terminal domain-containing protein [Saprospiraceae bacterium]MDW8230596.1 gliding motility-associated C-terminal domain-containing protein [Saprospiraceae bacterium]
MRKIYLTVLLFWLLGGMALQAQVFNMTGAPIFSCSGIFFDAGGSAGNYPNNQNLHTTICPDGAGNTQIALRFDSLVLAAGDTLCLLDGSTVFAPTLACYGGPTTVSSFLAKASPANAGGCLTVTFRSDAQGTAAGWAAAIQCAPCVLPAPANVQVVQMRNGDMRWQWDNVPGSTGFEVSLNGSPWQPANQPLGHVVSGLSPGDVVLIEIRPISPNPNCTVQTISVNKIYVECTLALALTSVSNARCAGTTTGSAQVLANGAKGPVQFYLVGNPTPFPNGNFTNFFAAGDYAVAVHDSAGCRDTVAFRIEEPLPLTVQTAMTDARCFADNSGIASATASGGTGALTFRWRRCQGGPVLNGATVPDLFAGCYAVTVQDANGCTAVAQDTIGEPPPFAFTSSQDSVRCHGEANGRATISASGATPPYTYQWSNGDTGTVADSLKAGFHSVTVTDAIGCRAVTLVQVLQPPLLRFDSLKAVGVTCFGSSDGLVSALALGGNPPLAYAWSNQQTGPVLTGLSAGTYTVVVTDRKGCTAAGTITVGTPPAITVQKSVQAERCAGQCDGAAVLTPNGGTPPLNVTWTTPGIPPGQTAPTNLCPGTYRFIVSDARNCSRTDSFTVAAAKPILLSFNLQPPRCAGGTDGSIEIVAQGGAPPYQCQWGNGRNENPLPGLACGAYSVTVSDALGCTQQSTATLPCPAPIVVDSARATPASCFGRANGTASIFARGGTGALSFRWSDPNQQVAALAVNLPAGIYTVTVSDANGCTATATVTVTQPAAIQATLFSKPVTCFNSTDGSAWAVVSGGIPPYTFLWNNQRTDSLLTGLGPGLYALTITDATGCTFTPPPVVVPSPSAPLQVTAVVTQRACFNGGGGAARAEATGGNGAPYTYTWSNQTTGPDATNLSTGTYTVTATDALGCTALQTVSIGRWDSIVVSIAVITPTCPNDRNGQASINRLEGGSGNGIRENYKLRWNIPGVGDTIYLSGLSSGQVIALTVTDNAGCTAVFERRIDSLPSIRPILQVDSIRCAGQNNGAVRVTSVQSVRPIASYRWSNGIISQSIIQLPPGTYTVTATDVQGCTGTASATLTEPPPLNVALQTETVRCPGDRNGSARALPSGGTPPYAFVWNTGARTERIENLAPGIYTVTLTDRYGCSLTATANLQPPDPLTIEVQTTPPVCFGYANGRATLVVQGGPPPLRFRLNGGPFTGSPTFVGLKAGAYTATVLDGNGCLTDVSFSLSQPPPVQVTLTPDTAIALGDSLLLQADVSNAVGGAAFVWQSALADSVRCADPPECSTVWITPPYSNTYTAIATDANGCTGAASVRVRVEKPRGVYVPTAFSPNGDGVNDRLVVHGKSRQIRRIRLFQVYDRWGALVFEARDFAPNDDAYGWDGLFRGQPAPVGVYVWYVEVEYRDGYEERLRGDTTLGR